VPIPAFPLRTAIYLNNGCLYLESYETEKHNVQAKYSDHNIKAFPSFSKYCV